MSSVLAHPSSPPPWLHLLPRSGGLQAPVDLNSATRAELRKKIGLSSQAIDRILGLRRRRTILNVRDAVLAAKLAPSDAGRLKGRGFGSLRSDILILDAVIDGLHIFSKKSWTLRVKFLPPPDGRAIVASVEIHWHGVPFVVEQRISKEESDAGEALIRFSEDKGLPPGPIEICVSILDDKGGAARQQLEAWVLPSNPFSMFLSAGGRSIFNGSVRPDWSAPNWITNVRFTFLNGDSTDVRMRRRVEWSFWDGGIGTGTRVESGAFDWPSDIVVPRFGNFSSGLTVTSPPGSGIHGKYEGKEDMAIELAFFKSDGTRVRAEITCRIMAGWGINVIRVGSYTAAETSAIAAGVADAQAVYENHGLTFSSVEFWDISNAQAGGYVMLGDQDEWEDLLDDWTVPNGSVDCFVVRSLWSPFAGLSPTPGPAGKDGACEDDGLAVELSLGCLAHELGHYMGGHPHADALGRGNVMHSICGGRSFTYNQYRAFLGHGFTHIVR